jgi:hypothetical protein
VSGWNPLKPDSEPFCEELGPICNAKVQFGAIIFRRDNTLGENVEKYSGASETLIVRPPLFYAL